MGRFRLFFSFVFLALTLFLPSFTPLLFILFFYLRRLHLSCSVSSVLLLISCSTMLSLSLSLALSFPLWVCLSRSLPTFRSLRWCPEGEDPLQQEGQCSDTALRWQPGSAGWVFYSRHRINPTCMYILHIDVSGNICWTRDMFLSFLPVAMSHLNGQKVFGKVMRVTLSKHQTVALPRDGLDDQLLTKGTSGSAS